MKKSSSLVSMSVFLMVLGCGVSKTSANDTDSLSQRPQPSTYSLVAKGPTSSHARQTDKDLASTGMEVEMQVTSSPKVASRKVSFTEPAASVSREAAVRLAVRKSLQGGRPFSTYSAKGQEKLISQAMAEMTQALEGLTRH